MAAAAALLIWAVRLVRTGFERAFGGQLRLWLRRSTDNSLSAALCGVVAAVLMQSSTAVAMLMAGFVSAGTIMIGSGLAIMLGADLGSAIVALALNSRIEAVKPFLLLVGVLIFLRSSRRRHRQIGRILIGFALIFVSLDLIASASLPLVGSEATNAVMAQLADMPLTAFVLAALFAWLVHSSVAAVLLFAALFAQGLLPLSAAFAMVLGANLGGSLIALFLTWNADIEVRRVISINFVLRGGGAIAILFVVTQSEIAFGWLSQLPGPAPLMLHLVFNALLLLLCLPLVRPLIKLAELLMPKERANGAAELTPSTLDPSLQDQPSRAYACVGRELVQMGNSIEVMLRLSIGLYQTFDEEVAQTISIRFKEIERSSLELKIYLAGISGRRDGEEIGREAFDLSAIAVNLEAGADIIATKMVGLAQRKANESLTFSEEGWRDLSDFHDTVLRNVQHAIAVLMSDDTGLARELVEQKEKVREIATALERNHLERIRQGGVQSIETSAIHLDLLRALKSLNTSFAMIAYPPLRQTGDLLESRLSETG